MTGSRMKTTRRPARAAAKSTRKLDANHNSTTRDEVAWLSLVGIYAAGFLAHLLLSALGAWYHWALIIACLDAATAIVAWRIWVLMGPRRKAERENVTAILAGGGLGASLTVLFADQIVWTAIYAILGAAAVLVFNMQESPRIRGRGGDTHPVVGIDPQQFNLAPGTTVRSKGDEVVIDHRDGQTTADVQGELRRWESMLRRAAGSLIARGGKHAGQTVIKVIDPAALDKPRVFMPPTTPATAAQALSIEDPIETGTYADGKRASTVYVGHALDMGVTGSGKSVLNQILAGLMLTRRDVCVLWCDPIAGPQSAGPVLDGVTWAAENDQEAKAMLNGLVTATKARIALLASVCDSAGQPMVAWTREAWDLHRIPQLAVFFDEAEWLMENQRIIQIAEQARKAGIRLRFMLPRASHSRMDTDLRAQLGRRTCFGVMSPDDAEFVLPEDVRDAGAAPEVWRDEFPGRHYAVGRGIPRNRCAMPIAADMPSRDGGRTLDLSVIADMVRAHSHVRAQLDPVTAQALGPAYVNWVAKRAGHLATATGMATPVTVATSVSILATAGHVTSGAATDGHVATTHDQDADTIRETVTEIGDMTVPTDDQVDLDGIDPDADDTDTSADDVDLGDITACRIPTGERNRLFLDLLTRRFEAGESAVHRTEVSKEWHQATGGGGKPWSYMRLERLCELGLMRQDGDDPAYFHFLSDPHDWSPSATTGGDESDPSRDARVG